MLQTHGKLISEENRGISLDKAEAKKFNLAILDDGLQDKKIDYDISIACFNSSYGIGNGYLLPAGPLREKLEILKKYSAIFLIGEKANQIFFSLDIGLDNFSTLNSVKVFPWSRILISHSPSWELKSEILSPAFSLITFLV